MSRLSNITLDLSVTNIFGKGLGSFKNYTFRDIGTKNLGGHYLNGLFKLNDFNTSTYDDDAIKNSLRNLLNFRPGLRILEPLYGNELYMYLYLPMMKFTGDKIVKTLVSMILRWLPRIKILSTPLLADLLNNTYYIQVNYYIPVLDKLGSVTVGINRDGSITL